MNKKTVKLLGKKVTYNQVNLNGVVTSKESVVIGDYHDGRFLYICLSNGDKMFSQALTIIE